MNTIRGDALGAAPLANFFNTVFDLLRLRAGPQDLPSSQGLTLVAVGAYIALGVITSETIAKLSTDPAATMNEPFRSLVGAALHFGAIGLILAWRRCPERFQQTALALASTGVVISVAALVLLMQNDPNVAAQPMLALLWFVIFGWSLAVDANILRHALDITLPIAMLVTVMLLAISYLVLELLFR
ncbi:MAG: hypothetical protein AAGH19_02405 [Pseudomonadota bacterium]